MAPFRREGRLRPGTLWAVFVIALLLGAIAGWLYRAWTHRTFVDRVQDVTKDARRAVEKLTR